MQTKTLELNTSYKETGNSTGCGLDTLGIAFNFGDSNDMQEHNYEHICSEVDYAKRHWIDTEAEDFFKKSLTKDRVLTYVDDLSAYTLAFSEYCEQFEGVDVCEYDDTNEAQKALAQALEKAEGEANDELYNLWLRGNYREAGLLDTVNKYFRYYDIEIDDAGQGEVSATIADGTMQLLIDDNELEEDATNDDVFEWIERVIDNKAYTIHDKETREREARRAERERVAKYQAEQKEKATERKKAELLNLIK